MAPNKSKIGKEKLPLTPIGKTLLAAFLTASTRPVPPKETLAQIELSLALCLTRTATQN